MSARLSSAERGDPEATGEAILKVVDAEQPPLRFIFGNTSLSNRANQRVIKGSVDDTIRHGRSATQTFQIFKITSIHLGPGSDE
jgi:hypothetical protein